MTVAIDAGAYSGYSGGIIGCNAGGTNINHAVQAVGYNADQNYWVIVRSLTHRPRPRPLWRPLRSSRTAHALMRTSE